MKRINFNVTFNGNDEYGGGDVIDRCDSRTALRTWGILSIINSKQSVFKRTTEQHTLVEDGMTRRRYRIYVLLFKFEAFTFIYNWKLKCD